MSTPSSQLLLLVPPATPGSLPPGLDEAGTEVFVLTAETAAEALVRIFAHDRVAVWSTLR